MGWEADLEAKHGMPDLAKLHLNCNVLMVPNDLQVAPIAAASGSPTARRSAP